MAQKYICSLDIGSSKIAGCCAQLKNDRIHSVIVDSVPVRGVKYGSIVDWVEFIDSARRLMKRLKEKSGTAIRTVVAGISGNDIITKHSSAVIPLSERGSKVITSADIEKVNAQARILGSSIDEEIIHCIPFRYTVDNKTDIINPSGLYGHKLEVDLFIIGAKLSSVQTLVHAINQVGFNVEELFFSGLAVNEVVFSTALRKGSDIICDIGSDFTELLFFNDGQISTIVNVPFGGDGFTSVIADSLDIPFEFAEEIRVSRGVIGDVSKVREELEVLVKKETGYKPIRQRLLCEILTSKAKSMAQSIRENIEKVCPLAGVNNFILLGRTIQQDGFLELLEQELGVSVEYGRLQDPKIAIPAVMAHEVLAGRKNLMYIRALGLAYLSLYSLQKKMFSPLSSHPNPFLRLTGKMKEIYQEYF